MLQKHYGMVVTLAASVLISASVLSQPATDKSVVPSQQAPPPQTPQPREVMKPEPQNPLPKVVIETKLVNLTVTVTDRFGRFVTGLAKEDFEVFDDKIAHEIAFFSNDDAPISMGIVYDVSGSMSNFSGRSVAMLRQFFENSHPEDEFCVIAFNNRPQLVHDFTSLPEEIINRAAFIKAKGSTSLFDATYLAVEKVRQGRHHKKVVLIFSDGEENSSRYSGRELKKLLQENDVQIYAIGIGGSLGGGEGTLRFLTEPTGGQTFFPFDPFSTELTYTRLALILRRQYTIGYYPNNVGSGTKWHNVQLVLSAPKEIGKVKLSYKNGYWITK